MEIFEFIGMYGVAGVVFFLVILFVDRKHLSFWTVLLAVPFIVLWPVAVGGLIYERFFK